MGTPSGLYNVSGNWARPTCGQLNERSEHSCCSSFVHDWTLSISFLFSSCSSCTISSNKRCRCSFIVALRAARCFSSSPMSSHTTANCFMTGSPINSRMQFCIVLVSISEPLRRYVQLILYSSELWLRYLESILSLRSTACFVCLNFAILKKL